MRQAIDIKTIQDTLVGKQVIFKGKEYVRCRYGYKTEILSDLKDLFKNNEIVILISVEDGGWSTIHIKNTENDQRRYYESFNINDYKIIEHEKIGNSDYLYVYSDQPKIINIW